MARQEMPFGLRQVWFGPRFLAVVLDGVILAIPAMAVMLYFFVSVVIPLFPPNVNSAEFEAVVPTVARSFLKLGALMYFFYYAYVIGLESLRGATLGKQLAGIRTVDLSNPTSRGVPVRKVVVREIVKILGYIPGLVLTVSVQMTMTSISGLAAPNSVSLEVLGSLAQLLSLGWLIWMIVSLVNKQDPIYDRLAATTVVGA